RMMILRRSLRRLSGLWTRRRTDGMKLSSKLESYSAALSGAAGLFTGIGVLLVTFAASRLVSKFVEYLVINQTFGHAAWASGLRLTDWRHAILSNGDSLSGWPYAAFYLGVFVLVIPFFLGSF